MTREEILAVAKSILFNTDMVRAILQNMKKATRRAIKGFIPDDAIWGYTAFTPKGYISCRGTFTDRYGEKFFRLPCQRGDILYVRETYCPNYFDYVTQYGNTHAYKADYDSAILSSEVTEPRWTPSIHMPKEAARIWLKVTDVRVERLQEITIVGCEEEGCWCAQNGDIFAFMALWDSTIKKAVIERYGWEANPWVWVIKFERCEKPVSM